MESYKLVNFDGLDEKAERLGLKCSKYDSGAPFVFMHSGVFYSVDSLDSFNEMDYQHILQADFLALPEPLKVGDWVKFTNCDGTLIFKIGDMNSSSCLPDKVIMNSFKPQLIGYCFTGCTKLSDEQIKILELES